MFGSAPAAAIASGITQRRRRTTPRRPDRRARQRPTGACGRRDRAAEIAGFLFPVGDDVTADRARRSTMPAAPRSRRRRVADVARAISLSDAATVRSPSSGAETIRPQAPRPSARVRPRHSPPAVRLAPPFDGRLAPKRRKPPRGGFGSSTMSRTRMVQLGGLEPPTFGATIRRSNQLSYSCTGLDRVLIGDDAGLGKRPSEPLPRDRPRRNGSTRPSRRTTASDSPYALRTGRAASLSRPTSASRSTWRWRPWSAWRCRRRLAPPLPAVPWPGR